MSQPCTWTVFVCLPGCPEEIAGTVVAETYEEAWTAANERFEYVTHVHPTPTVSSPND